MSVYELDWIAGGPPTLRLFSRAMSAERIGIMVAWITVTHQVGGAAAAYLGGALRSGSGTYFEAFMMAGLMCIGSAREADGGAGGRVATVESRSRR
jgi:sugar phosphate permease